MNTRKFPRTMQEAFGPYTDHRISEPEQRAGYGWLWWAIVSACGAAAVYFNITT